MPLLLVSCQRECLARISVTSTECLRDIGLEDQVTRLSNGGEMIEHMRWSDAMNGREYGRIFAWGKGEMQVWSLSLPRATAQSGLKTID